MEKENISITNAQFKQDKVCVAYLIDSHTIAGRREEFFREAKIKRKNTPLERGDTKNILKSFIGQAHLLAPKHRGIYEDGMDLFYAEYKSLEELEGICVLLKLKEFPVLCAIKIDSESLVEIRIKPACMKISNEIYESLRYLEDNILKLRERLHPDCDKEESLGDSCDAFKEFKQKVLDENGEIYDTFKELTDRVVVPCFRWRRRHC